MDLAIEAVFGSWNSERAILYRRQERIATDLGTAVNICSMVFGNLGMDSGTGVCFTRDPSTGQPGVYGDYLQNAQGEDVVAGIRNTVPLADLEQLDKTSYDELMAIMAKFEGHYRDLCDIEFTVERGKLWMLQTRVGKRTAAAAFRIATSLIDEGVIDTDEALKRVKGAQLAQLMFPRFDADAAKDLITKAIGASPGAASGKVVFTSAAAVEAAEKGEKVILVRRETNPDDLHGMIAAQGILTSRGGKTSHAAVVARGMGKTCVCGAEELEVNVAEGIIKLNGTVLHAGRRRSRSTAPPARSSRVRFPVVPSPVVQYFEGSLDPEAGDELVGLGAPADHPRRRGTAPRRTDECGHRGRRGAGAAVRRRGDRAVPDRAHVPRRAPGGGRAADPGRRRRRSRSSAGRAGALAAWGLPGAARRDGRSAGDDPADRPAAARVPAVDGGPRGQGRAGQRAR